MTALVNVVRDKALLRGCAADVARGQLTTGVPQDHRIILHRQGYQCQGWIVHPGPDLPGFSGAGEGVHACSADSIATKILGFHA
jgi:hypothetical protein